MASRITSVVVCNRLQGANVEPDGALLIESERGAVLLVIPPHCIDSLVEALIKHSGSEGDGRQWEIDLSTGSTRTLT
jgi:hypothetical protein